MTTTTGRIDIPSLANDDAASGDGGGPPHTFDERAMIEIGQVYGAFGSGPPGGRTGAPPYSVDVDRAPTSSSRSSGGAEGGGGGRRCVFGGNGKARRWSTLRSPPELRRLTALPASVMTDRFGWRCADEPSTATKMPPTATALRE